MADSLAHVYYVWSVLLRTYSIFSQPVRDIVNEQNSRIIELFVKSVLGSPIGQRSAVIIMKEGYGNSTDKKNYGLVRDVSYFCRLSIDPFIKFIANLFHEKISQCQVAAGLASDQRVQW